MFLHFVQYWLQQRVGLKQQKGINNNNNNNNNNKVYPARDEMEIQAETEFEGGRDEVLLYMF